MDYIYLILHGILTIGAIFGFVIRLEHRITRLETKLENFEKRWG